MEFQPEFPSASRVNRASRISRATWRPTACRWPDLTHPTFPEQGGDVVMAEVDAGTQRHSDLATNHVGLG